MIPDDLPTPAMIPEDDPPTPGEARRRVELFLADDRLTQAEREVALDWLAERGFPIPSGDPSRRAGSDGGDGREEMIGRAGLVIELHGLTSWARASVPPMVGELMDLALDVAGDVRRLLREDG